MKEGAGLKTGKENFSKLDDTKGFWGIQTQSEPFGVY